MKPIVILLAVVLILGIAGCSKKEASPTLSITNPKAAQTTLPTDPPELVKDLWAQTNPMPGWIEGHAKEPNPNKVMAEKIKESEDLPQVLQMLEKIKGRLDLIDAKTSQFESEKVPAMSKPGIHPELRKLCDNLRETRYLGSMNIDKSLGVFAKVEPETGFEDMDGSVIGVPGTFISNKQQFNKQ